MIFQNKSYSDKTEFELRKEKQFPEKPVNLSKKRKNSNVDLNNLQDEASLNHTISSDKPACLEQLDSGNLNVQTSLCDANHFEKNVLEKNNDIFNCDENLSNTMLQSQDQSSLDLWQICKYAYLSCKAKNIIEQSAVKACCKKCDKEQHVV